MIRSRWGTVRSTGALRFGAQALEVELDGEPGIARAVAYPAITGVILTGSRVMLNTTAVALGLGTGGVHFVMAVEDQIERDDLLPGRTMKLRYTPEQLQVMAAEEEGSPHRDALAGDASLEGTPVVWIPLHSMLAPAVAGALAAGASRVAYVMTDGAALPAPFSRLAASLRHAGLLAGVVSTGQAFGGDVESVNVFTGLLSARLVLGADVIVVGDGPGNTGTNTVWGASDIESAMSLNAVHILGGQPVAALRISFADPRERHRVVSHHSLTALSRVVMAGAHVAVPALDHDARRTPVWDALREAKLEERHQLVEVNGRPALDLLAERGVEVISMGRGPADDPEFFLAAGAAGVLAGGMARRNRAWKASE